MGETYSINYLRNRLTSITALAIFWISLSLAYTQILSSSPVAFADEINLSDELSSQETNPCNLWLSGTSRSSTSASLTPLGDTNAINGEQPGGLREYLSQIQTQISRFWSLLPRNLPEAVLTTVVNFRLDRAGMITNVNIQQSSGNEYSDLAARQALKSAVPLPQFPRYIADRYLDVVYTFSVERLNATSDRSRGPVVRRRGLAGTELVVINQSASEESWGRQKYQYSACRTHLRTLPQIIDEVPNNQTGLKKLQGVANGLRFPDINLESFDDSDVPGLIKDIRQRIAARSEEITLKLATDSEMDRFDHVCKSEILKAGFPYDLREEPVASSRPETKTLGRAFCTAINGGGKVEFKIIDKNPPMVGIAVTTKKRQFVVVLQKKMQGDLSEEWTAIEIQTPSDRKPIINMLGYSFMDIRFPALVQNE